MHAGFAGPQQAVWSGVNPIPSAAEVPLQHVFQLGIQAGAHKRFVAGVVQITAHRLKQPQGRVHRIVFRLFAAIRKTIGQHPPIRAIDECPQNVTGDFEAPGQQRQARQRHHGVAAPIAKPMIAGDHRMQITALDDELIRRRSQFLNKGIRRRRGAGHLASPQLFLALQFRRFIGTRNGAVNRIGVRTADGCDHCRLASGQFIAQNKWIEQVFAFVQAAFAFGGIVEIEIPVAGLFRMLRIVGNLQRGQTMIGSDAHCALANRNRAVQRIIMMRGRMIIAKSN